ncbi:SH3 domain-containing protein [Paraburkholderia flagellata]|uniref:SH3 domain-containing protein n=1 Tax=Paraburkholderia flagellata TaxID=2883241 RepID=UPI001F1A7F2D|nr:SH3 domain-containing protein [Paraburkholderia flagellata]
MSKRLKTRALASALASACLATGLVLASSDASAQTAAYTSQPVDLYAGPSGDYPVVSELGPGQPVTVMGCVSDYSWCDVTVPGLRGWVYGGYLSYPYQGSYVPLTSYGAAIGLPVVAFSLGAYWGSFYRDRPWYGEQQRWEHVAPPERGRPPATPAWHGAPGHPPAMPHGGGERPPEPNASMRGGPPQAAERPPGNQEAPRAPGNMPPPGAGRPPANMEQPAMRPHEAGHPPEQQQFGGRPPAGAPAQGYARPPEPQPQGGMRAPGPAPQQGRPPAPPQGGQGGHAPSQGGERGNDRQPEH